MTATLPVKLTPPEPGRYFVRQDLMQQLAEYVEAPRRVWISSPGGSGKTALARNFLTSDPRPLLWYQVDSDDQDPANLFFYLSKAVPQAGAEPLPQFSQEYLPNLELFCRNFCRTLFANIGEGFVLVFDDLQEGPGESLFGPFLSAAMAELPQNASLIVISRGEPYPVFARQRVNNSLAHLGWDGLQLSADETRQFLTWSRNEEPLQQTWDRACELTQGWMAGLLLFAENRENVEQPHQIPMDRTDLLFDYFAGEVFAKLPEATRNFLYACSFPPAIDVGMAEMLTDHTDAGKILSELVRSNNFTYRISATPEIYRFHPLFRQFLQSHATEALDEGKLAHCRHLTAHLLVENGQIEPAAELLIEARAWPQLIELISSEAENLLQQSRTQTLLQWLDALPASQRDNTPWLHYWRGNCLMAVNPMESLRELSRAFELFEEEGNAAGSMLSWGMVVNAIVIVWNDYSVLDKWIARFDRLLERYADYPSQQIESLMVQGICKSLAWRYPARPDLPMWAERLEQLVTTSNDSDFRLLAGSNLVLYHAVSGDIAVARSLVGILDSDLNSKLVSPLKKLVWRATRGVLQWSLMDYEGCAENLKAGQQLIDESGVHVLDVRLFSQSIIMALTTGDLPMAKKLLDKLSANPITTAFDHGHYSFLLAELSLQEGDTAKAVALAETAAKLLGDGGNVVMKAHSLPILVLALYQDGQHDRAMSQLRDGLEYTVGTKVFRCYLNLLGAYFALEKGEDDAAHQYLIEGLGIAARQGYLNFMPWRDEIMTRLCREAIANGIEVEYVTRLATTRNLNISDTAELLTPKEMTTLGWVQQGKTTWEIAKIMDVSEGTVKFHVGNVLRKLGAKSRTQAVAMALREGLLAEKQVQ